MTHYQRGNYWEVKAADELREAGYTVWQSRGSHGAADLIALKRGRMTLLVQVKSGQTGVSGDSWNELLRLAVELDAVPLVARRTGHSQIEWVQITRRHYPGSPKWGCVSWQPNGAQDV